MAQRVSAYLRCLVHANPMTFAGDQRDLITSQTCTFEQIHAPKSLFAHFQTNLLCILLYNRHALFESLFICLILCNDALKLLIVCRELRLVPLLCTHDEFGNGGACLPLVGGCNLHFPAPLSLRHVPKRKKILSRSALTCELLLVYDGITIVRFGAGVVDGYLRLSKIHFHRTRILRQIFNLPLIVRLKHKSIGRYNKHEGIFTLITGPAIFWRSTYCKCPLCYYL